MTPASCVFDVNGCRYALGRCIGRGGQGEVYEIEHTRLAAKLLKDRSPKTREQLRNQLTGVRILNLKDLPIAKPLELLRGPDLGYIMELVTGMVPISVLTQLPPGAASPAQWYMQTGGLRRRLRLLARTADVLGTLHSRGLIYSDVSPNNVFVSEDLDFNEVWLIDADNLRYQTSPCERAYYTPGYGAPEIVKGDTEVNSLSESFSFAVLAFHVLAATHPLIGDILADGEPELENEAFEGRLPWIDHRIDDRNSSRFGIPREMVLSGKLDELFRRTFEGGLLDPQQRPSLAEWANRLHTAADSTVMCAECKGTFYSSAHRCPWCDAKRPPYAICAFSLFDPEREGRQKIVTRLTDKGERHLVVSRLCIGEGESCNITERLGFGKSGISAETPILTVRFLGDKLIVNLRRQSPHYIVLRDGNGHMRITERTEYVPLGSGQWSPWTIHFGRSDEFHRSVSFGLSAGAER
jgi:DNA-binding helix-hairpin-helix protein with protein kinase domain